MKQFCCGDVVPGCTAIFKGNTDDEILGAVGEHAKRDHGMTSIANGIRFSGSARCPRPCVCNC